MHGFTRNDPQPFSRGKGVASEQAFPARCAMICHLDRRSENRLPRKVQDVESRSGIPSNSAGDGVPNLTCKVHDERLTLSISGELALTELTCFCTGELPF